MGKNLKHCAGFSGFFIAISKNYDGLPVMHLIKEGLLIMNRFFTSRKKNFTCVLILLFSLINCFTQKDNNKPNLAFLYELSRNQNSSNPILASQNKCDKGFNYGAGILPAGFNSASTTPQDLILGKKFSGSLGPGRYAYDMRASVVQFTLTAEQQLEISNVIFWQSFYQVVHQTVSSWITYGPYVYPSTHRSISCPLQIDDPFDFNVVPIKYNDMLNPTILTIGPGNPGTYSLLMRGLSISDKGKVVIK